MTNMLLAEPTIGAAAITAKETFGGTWPFAAKYLNVRGARMHYVDEGQGQETLLLLHGEPTWGYLFRHQIRQWSERARVIGVDHLGFGKSDTPADRSYWLQDHIDNLEAFVLARDLSNLTLVMHDFGGPTGMGLAARHPDRVARIISVNGPTPFGQPDLVDRVISNASESPWFQWIQRAHDGGYLKEVLGHLDFNILSTMKLNGFFRNEIINDIWLDAYGAPFPTKAQAAGAIGWAQGFAEGMHQFEEPDAAARKRISKLPAIAIWGEEDRTLHAKHFLPLFEQAFPAGRIHRVPYASHYSPEDAPDAVADLVNTFIH